jgi:hypothetical protein
MTHVQTLRGMTAANRHDPLNAAATQLRVNAGAAIRHTTDPAKLGAGGSMTFPGADARLRPGAERLAGASRGWEYGVPFLNAARLIEVERTGVTSWYLSMDHYTTYRLIVGLP